MLQSWIKTPPTLVALLSLCLATLLVSGPSPAEAGKKKLFFGAHQDSYGNARYGGNAYKKNTRKAKARARARARAAKKRKARAAAKARATAAKNRDSGATENNTTAVPSTAVLLTRKELDAKATMKTKRPAADRKVTVATTSDDDNVDTSSSAAAIGEGACRKFVPEVGTAVAVPCD